MRKIGFVAAAALVASPAMVAPAFAQAAQQPAQTSATHKVLDPNEVVCEKQQDISSRLVMNRVCQTRAQWAEQRRLDRQDIEKIQTQRDLSH